MSAVMPNPRRYKVSSLISATEVAEFVFCEKAWYLKRAGARAQGERLEPGAQFHRQHGSQVASASRLGRLAGLLALLAVLLLVAAALLRGLENFGR